MTLTNYWWIIIWVIVGGGICAIAFPSQTEFVMGKQRNLWNPFTTYVFIAPLIVWAGFRKNFGDTEQYRKTFFEMSGNISEFSDFYKSLNKDRFFYSFEYLFKSVFGNKDVLFFLLLAAIQIIIISQLYRKYSPDYWFAMILFVATTDYLSWTFNGTRQFLAVTIVYAGTNLFLKKKYIWFILLIILASRFHGSALLMIPVIFIIEGKALNKKTIICVILSIIALVYISKFTSILDTMLSDTQYTNVVSDWQSWNDDGMNPIRAIVYSVPTLFALLGYRFIKAENDPVINMAANASFVTTAVAILAVGTSGIFIGRLPIYTSLYANGIMLPWAIDNMFTEESAKLVKIAAVIMYLLFFYYQMHFTWGAI